jgi:acetyltransferase-like isoleucine patch superfamily enzyme
MRTTFLSRLLSKAAFVSPGGYSVRPALQRWRGVRLGKNVWVAQYVYFDELHPDAIHIGDNCTIGLRCSIFTHFYWGPRKQTEGVREVRIEKDVFIGPHCVILPGVTVGEGSVIQAGCTVTRNVPAHTFWGPSAAGPLAQVTVPLTPEHGYEKYIWGLRPAAAKRRGSSTR